jgi:hypothetical protein
LASSADERRVVDETVLGRVALCLECSEKSFLGTKNLNCGGRIFCKVGEGTGVGDEASSNSLPYECRKVRCYDAHLCGQIVAERFAIVGEVDCAFGECHHVLHVQV